MATIYHMLPWPEWEAARGKTEYAAPSLAAQGFIHASGDLDQLLWVANRLYRDVPRLAVLCIDRSRVRPAVKDEPGGHARPFPHIYGPLNTDAIIEVRELRPGWAAPATGEPEMSDGGKDESPEQWRGARKPAGSGL